MSKATSNQSDETTVRWGITHFQWGAIMNLGEMLLILSFLDWETASLVLGFVAVLPFGIGFWMFFDTVEDRSLAGSTGEMEGHDDV